jgi:hypothetical protein
VSGFFRNCNGFCRVMLPRVCSTRTKEDVLTGRGWGPMASCLAGRHGIPESTFIRPRQRKGHEEWKRGRLGDGLRVGERGERAWGLRRGHGQASRARSAPTAAHVPGPPMQRTPTHTDSPANIQSPMRNVVECWHRTITNEGRRWVCTEL